MHKKQHISDRVITNYRRAAFRGERDKVLNYLDKQGVDVDACESDGVTALMGAIVKGNMSMIELLLEKGADPNRKKSGTTDPGETALHVAASTGFFTRPEMGDEIIRRLVQAGADVNARNDRGETPLIAAIPPPMGQGDVQRMKTLIELGADVDARDNAGNTALMRIVNRKNCPAAWDLLQNTGAGEGGMNTVRLFEAIEANDLTEVRKQLRAGADVNHRFRGTPLTDAANSDCDVDIVRALIEAGADVNLTDSDGGMTPLMWAASRPRPDIVKCLLDHGADPHVKDEYGSNALDHTLVDKSQALVNEPQDKRTPRLYDESIAILKAAGVKPAYRHRKREPKIFKTIREIARVEIRRAEKAVGAAADGTRNRSKKLPAKKTKAVPAEVTAGKLPSKTPLSPAKRTTAKKSSTKKAKGSRKP